MLEMYHMIDKTLFNISKTRNEGKFVRVSFHNWYH